MPHDPINHPVGYTSHPTGIECNTINEHYNFNLGNVFKYIWPYHIGGPKERKPGTNMLEDLTKARWYLTREIDRLCLERAKSARDRLCALSAEQAQAVTTNLTSRDAYTDADVVSTASTPSTLRSK